MEEQRVGRKKESKEQGGGLKTEPCQLWAHFGKHRTGLFVCSSSETVDQKDWMWVKSGSSREGNPTDLRQAAVLCTSYLFHFLPLWYQVTATAGFRLPH